MTDSFGYNKNIAYIVMQVKFISKLKAFKTKKLLLFRSLLKKFDNVHLSNKSYENQFTIVLFDSLHLKLVKCLINNRKWNKVVI